MDYTNKKLQAKQIDQQLNSLRSNIINVPHKGWIYTIRKTIGMSLVQLGAKLAISHQAVSNLEKREIDETITIGKLKEAGQAMGLIMVYGFVPEKSLEKMIETKARDLATKIVMRTSNHMAMENQKVKDKRLKEAIEERTQEIIRTLPKNLWD